MRKLTMGGRINVRLVSSLTRLDLTKIYCYFLLFVGSHAVESKIVKHETSLSKAILSPTELSVLSLFQVNCKIYL